jgi:ribonuclease P protein component
VLAADHRLRDSSSFRRTVRSGRRAGSRALVVHLYVGDRDRPDGANRPGAAAAPRVGFVVSRAVGGAVVRNLVQRRLRHLVKDLMSHLPASSELVVRALPAAATMTSAELRVELSRCLQRVGVADPVVATASGSGAGS